MVEAWPRSSSESTGRPTAGTRCGGRPGRLGSWGPSWWRCWCGTCSASIMPTASGASIPHYDDTHADRALLAAVEDALGAEAAARVARRTPCDLPAPGLLGAAKGADLLVVGARGAGGFPGLQLGSVSQQVLHHARRPVAVVRSAVGPGRPAGGRPGARGRRRLAVVADRAALGGGRGRPAGGDRGGGPRLGGPRLVGPAPGRDPYAIEALDQAAHALVDTLVDEATAGAPGVAVERRVVHGGAAAGLLEAAQDAGADRARAAGPGRLPPAAAGLGLRPRGPARSLPRGRDAPRGGGRGMKRTIDARTGLEIIDATSAAACWRPRRSAGWPWSTGAARPCSR